MAAAMVYEISESSDEADNVSLPSVCYDVILVQSDSEGSLALPSEVEDNNDWNTYMSARLSMDCDEANEQASGASVAMGGAGQPEPPGMFAKIFSRP